MVRAGRQVGDGVKGAEAAQRWFDRGASSAAWGGRLEGWTAPSSSPGVGCGERAALRFATELGGVPRGEGGRVGVHGGKGGHDHEASGATGGAGVARGRSIGALPGVGLGEIGRLAQERAAAGEGPGATAIAEEPILADVVKAVGKPVEQEAAQELDGVERHGAGALAVRVVLPAKGDLPIGH